MCLYIHLCDNPVFWLQSLIHMCKSTSFGLRFLVCRLCWRLVHLMCIWSGSHIPFFIQQRAALAMPTAWFAVMRYSGTQCSLYICTCTSPEYLSLSSSLHCYCHQRLSFKLGYCCCCCLVWLLVSSLPDLASFCTRGPPAVSHQHRPALTKFCLFSGGPFLCSRPDLVASALVPVTSSLSASTSLAPSFSIIPPVVSW